MPGPSVRPGELLLGEARFPADVSFATALEGSLRQWSSLRGGASSPGREKWLRPVRGLREVRHAGPGVGYVAGQERR